MKLTHGSLFSGKGGFDKAAEDAGFENIFHCEINPFGQKILNHYWPEAKSYDDISTTDFTVHRGQIGVLTGGFPCQDASIGKTWNYNKDEQGLNGSRTGLFYEMCRAIRETGPDYVVAENVANLLTVNKGQDFSRILTELSGMGYNAEWRICRASEVGAPHNRARLYLVAYPGSIRLQKGQTFFSHVCEASSPKPWMLDGTTVQTFRGGAWTGEPPLLLMDDGFPFNVDGTTVSNWRRESIKASGNAVVPQIPYAILKAIKEYEQLKPTLCTQNYSKN